MRIATEQDFKMKYYPIIGVDPEGNEINLELPLDFTSPEIMSALTWYFENGWTLKGKAKQ